MANKCRSCIKVLTTHEQDQNMQRRHSTLTKFMRQRPQHPRLYRSTTRTGGRQHPNRHSPSSGSPVNSSQAAEEWEQSYCFASEPVHTGVQQLMPRGTWAQRGTWAKLQKTDSTMLLFQLIQVLTVHPSLSYLSLSCTVTSLGMGCSRKISNVNHDAADPYISSAMFPQPATLVQKTISNKAVKHLHCSVTTKSHIEFNQTGKRETGTFLIQAHSPIITMELQTQPFSSSWSYYLDTSLPKVFWILLIVGQNYVWHNEYIYLPLYTTGGNKYHLNVTEQSHEHAQSWLCS